MRIVLILALALAAPAFAEEKQAHVITRDVSFGMPLYRTPLGWVTVFQPSAKQEEETSEEE